MIRLLGLSAAIIACAVALSSAEAGIVVSTYADQATWAGTPAIPTTATPQASLTVNQQVGAGTSLTQSFKTGAAGFKLGAIDIYTGGKSGGTARLNIYPDPIGGENTDGFVNTSFSTDLLNGGAGLEFTYNGSPGAIYIHLDLTDADEITLAPNQQYAIEFDNLSGQFSWMRSAAAGYPDGNIYQGATEGGFNGTPPANNRGQRNQVGGSPDRDGGLALFGVPEPTSLVLMALALPVVCIAERRRAK